MRISLILLFAVFMQLSANDSFAQRVRTALGVSRATVEQVLNKIEETSDYVFLYNDKTIQTNRMVTLNTNSRQISDILNDVFAGTNVTYTIVDKQIILSTRKVVPEQNPQRVTGNIKDANGEPLIGVSILEKGTTNGTVTDLDGNFLLQAKLGGYWKSAI